MITVLWFAIAAVMLAADLVTKHLALSLRGGEELVVIKNVLSFNYVENPGGAWGIFKSSAWIIIVITTAAIIAIPALMIIYRKVHPLFSLSLSLIWSGAIGNYIGHVFDGYVVDFIQVKFINFPSFNVADCCITVGAILLGVYIVFLDKHFFRDGKKRDKKPEEQTPDTENGSDPGA